jgi:hypothetical protein
VHRLGLAMLLIRYDRRIESHTEEPELLALSSCNGGQAHGGP